MPKKSTFIAYLLWLVGGLGVLGLHRFYLGKVGTGFIWLITGGVVLVGAMVDLFLIPKMIIDYHKMNPPPPSGNDE